MPKLSHSSRVKSFQEYLEEKGKPAMDDNETNDLPSILHDFYSEVCKKRASNCESIEYKNSSMK